MTDDWGMKKVFAALIVLAAVANMVDTLAVTISTPKHPRHRRVHPTHHINR